MVRGSGWRVLAALAQSPVAPLRNQAAGKSFGPRKFGSSEQQALGGAAVSRTAAFSSISCGWARQHQQGCQHRHFSTSQLQLWASPKKGSRRAQPQRRNMRHDAAYRPTVAPYDAQNAVLRITGRVFARARDVQQSVKKMNPLARLVRRLHIDDALVQLALVNKKKSARALYEVLMSGRAAARQRQLDVGRLVVDEALVLRGPYARRPPLFRAKGGVHYPRRSTCHVYVRLREVEGAAMKTVVLRPWWERRQRHHRAARKGGRGWITSRAEFAAAVDAAPAAAGA